jgi:uncharacterized protein (TIGR02145 family)
MKQKLFFLMLTLFVLGAANVNAQVTIGSAENPHSGAVLDLKSTTQGLKLPTVRLDDLEEFGLPLTTPSTTENAKGMFVYNTNATIGEGVYVWDGLQWGLVKGSVGSNPVTSITVSAAGDATSLIFGSTLQLSATIEPEDASNPYIDWIIKRGAGAATISDDGLVSGRNAGTVVIYAAASNGVYGEIELEVYGDGTPISQTIGQHEYLTYNFGGLIWMIENSMEGESSYQMYDSDPNKVSGYYYTPTQARSTDPEKTPCPDGWRLPRANEATNLRSYLSGSSSLVEEAILFQDYAELAGRHLSTSNVWGLWGEETQIVLGDADSYMYFDAYPTMMGTNVNTQLDQRFISVRCVRPS